MTVRAKLAAVSICGVLLSGCGHPSDPVTASSSVTSTPGAGAGASTFVPVPVPEENDDELQTLGPLGQLTEQDKADTRRRAVDFLRAYTATDQDPAAWWAGVQPLLSPAAAEDYSYVDPAEVPTLSTPTGDVRVLPDGSSSLVQVQVPTSIGDYVVTLARDGSTSPWLVARADSPAEAP